LTLDQPNVLVEHTGHARITDFGLAKIIRNLDPMQTTLAWSGPNARWTAPEVCGGGEYSTEADVFSFAMVIIEARPPNKSCVRVRAYHDFELMQVFTGAAPSSDLPAFKAMFLMAQGERPPRPMHPEVTDSLWELVQRCWDHEPHSRPEVPEVLQVLRTLSVPRLSWRPCVF
jgi:serine/threonine protein kinase